MPRAERASRHVSAKGVKSTVSISRLLKFLLTYAQQKANVKVNRSFSDRGLKRMFLFLLVISFLSLMGDFVSATSGRRRICLLS